MFFENLVSIGVDIFQRLKFTLNEMEADRTTNNLGGPNEDEA